MMKVEAIKKLSVPVPRYTSYPTALDFDNQVNETKYRNWLSQIHPRQDVSLYVHIPFCDRLCWFCACHTKQVNRYEPISSYLDAVLQEIELLHQAIGFTPSLRQLHLGGGSPSLLRKADLMRLRECVDSHFNVTDAVDLSVEIDPSDMSAEMFSAFEALGITRASIGVQDFAPEVQQAINRPQSLKQTSLAVAAMRQCGVHSVNIDLLYGLPYQTVESVAKTTRQVAALYPDRVAMFGYAHVPWMKKHQRMISQETLPDEVERVALAKVAADILLSNGFVQIGIDHFARPEDSLAKAAASGRLKRNFQGYTDDPCATLIGIGASAIGKLRQGYIQNETPTAKYMRMVSNGKLPVSRGIELTADDLMYADVIEQLMCQFQFSLSQLRCRYGHKAAPIEDRVAEVLREDEDQLSAFDGDNFVIRPEARPFARVIASWFDARIQQNKGRCSIAV